MADGIHPTKTIACLKETFMKREPKQSSELAASEKIKVFKDATFEINWLRPAVNGHYEIELKQPIENIYNWFIYNTYEDKHWAIEEAGYEAPTDTAPEKPANKGPQVYVPGRGNVYLNDPIQTASPHFKWYEATKNGARIPETESITFEIEKIALALAPVREEWGSITVTSWYRPPEVNYAVGGASNSQHLTGSGIDIHPNEHAIYTFQTWCVNNWAYGGVGMGAAKGFVHLDMRGYPAVWTY